MFLTGNPKVTSAEQATGGDSVSNVELRIWRPVIWELGFGFREEGNSIPVMWLASGEQAVSISVEDVESGVENGEMIFTA